MRPTLYALAALGLFSGSLVSTFSGCEAPGTGAQAEPASLPDTCVPVDDAAYVERALRCYPPCVRAVVASCLPQGACSYTSEQWGCFNGAETDYFKNCVEVYSAGGIDFPENPTRVSRSGTLCFSRKRERLAEGAFSYVFTKEQVGSFTVEIPTELTNADPMIVRCDGNEHSIHVVGTDCVNLLELGFGDCTLRRD